VATIEKISACDYFSIKSVRLGSNAAPVETLIDFDVNTTFILYVIISGCGIKHAIEMSEQANEYGNLERVTAQLAAVNRRRRS
jgi:hypothetical protein